MRHFLTSLAISLGRNTFRPFLARLRRPVRDDLISFGLLNDIEFFATALGSPQDHRGQRGRWVNCHIEIAFDDSNEEGRFSTIIIHRAGGVVAPCVIGVVRLSGRLIETFLLLTIS